MDRLVAECAAIVVAAVKSGGPSLSLSPPTPSPLPTAPDEDAAIPTGDRDGQSQEDEPPAEANAFARVRRLGTDARASLLGGGGRTGRDFEAAVAAALTEMLVTHWAMSADSDAKSFYDAGRAQVAALVRQHGTLDGVGRALMGSRLSRVGASSIGDGGTRPAGAGTPGQWRRLTFLPFVQPRAASAARLSFRGASK
jgi:hypothetical protein